MARRGSLASFAGPSEPFVGAHVLPRHPSDTPAQLAAKARAVLERYAPDLVPMVLGEEAQS